MVQGKVRREFASKRDGKDILQGQLLKQKITKAGHTLDDAQDKPRIGPKGENMISPGRKMTPSQKKGSQQTGEERGGVGRRQIWFAYHVAR